MRCSRHRPPFGLSCFKGSPAAGAAELVRSAKGAKRLMLGMKVTITRYLSDDPQPGIVECELVDVHGRRWLFVEKTAVVSANTLDAKTVYPQSGVIAGEVVKRNQDAAGREVLTMNTERPWGVTSVDGATRFDVRAESLVKL